MKTSIQGFKGSFHHQVAAELGLGEDLLMRSSFREVFEDVKKGEAEVGVLAIENSIAGAILENYDLLKTSGLQVVGEYYLRIKMSLLAAPGASLADIEEVRSHPMALKQVQQYLDRFPQITQVTHPDTALAVEEIIQAQSKNIAGVAGEFAANALGAEVLAEGIETDKQNYTRFLLIERHDNAKAPELNYPSNGKTKTMIYMETDHQPGSLLKALQVFDDLNLNMTMLVSRPVVGEAWHYGFYIDFETEKFSEQLMRVKLNPVTEKLLIFGTYPAFQRN